MGFSAINDPRILKILQVDQNLPSRSQIIMLEENLHNVLDEMKNENSNNDE